MMQIVQQIVAACKLPAMHVQRVAGGDINEAYLLYNTTQRFFLKINDAQLYPGMFAAEADGLNALRSNSHFCVPQVIQTGIVQTTQYLLLEWIERTTPDERYWENMGKQLAAMHAQPQPTAGWKTNNYIGSIPQFNNETHSWTAFYAEQRILPFVKRLLQAGIFTNSEMQYAEAVCLRMSSLFPNEPHALLHGDLWSGNHFPNEKGLPVLIDPAVYCGHREMDLGMTCLFGGFHQRFYEAYHYHYPLETLWQQRLQLTQLYPLLVHAVLFGGNYVQQSAAILARFGG